MRSKITAGVIVSVNEAMDVWAPGYLVIEGDSVLEAGPGPGPAGRFDAVVELADHVVMPGLVNAHAHSPSNLLKGTWSRLPLEIWRQYIRAGWREYSDEAIAVSSELGLLEMLKTGCTAVLDHFYTGSTSAHMGALHAVDAMQRAGMRGALALTLSDRTYDATIGLGEAGLTQGARAEIDRISHYESLATLDDAERFAEATRALSDLVQPMIGPSAPHRCTDELLTACMRLAERLEMPMHMHVAETRAQFVQGARLFGRSPVAHLDAIGILNERMSMAHCIWLTRDDIARVADRGATIIHNPASNAKLGSGRMRYEEMLSAGARVGLATDGSGSNDTQNMFEAMRLAALLHTSPDRDYLTWPSPEQVLRSATVDGAHALGMGGRIGRIASGYAADLVALTTDSTHLTPLNDVLNQLVFSENGASVTDVMVAGRWIVRDREVLTIDERRLYQRARALREEMDERLRAQFLRTDALTQALRDLYLRSAGTTWDPDTGLGAASEGVEP